MGISNLDALHTIFVCGSLHLFLSAARGRQTLWWWLHKELIHESSRISLEIILLFCLFVCWCLDQLHLVFPLVSGLSRLWPLVIQAVMDMGSFLWSGAEVKSDLGWLRLYVLCHHYPSIFLMKDRFLVKDFSVWVGVHISLLVPSHI